MTPVIFNSQDCKPGDLINIKVHCLMTLVLLLLKVWFILQEQVIKKYRNIFILYFLNWLNSYVDSSRCLLATINFKFLFSFHRHWNIFFHGYLFPDYCTEQSQSKHYSTVSLHVNFLGNYTGIFGLWWSSRYTYYSRRSYNCSFRYICS